MNARVSALVAVSAVVLAELVSLVLVFRAFFPIGDLWGQVAQWIGDTYRDPGLFRLLVLFVFGSCLLWFVRAGYSCARVMTEGAAGWPGQAALLILVAVIVPPAIILTRDWWHPQLLRAFAGSSGAAPPFLKYVPEYLTVCYMASLHTFLLYGEDKYRAMTDRWRIPEDAALVRVLRRLARRASGAAGVPPQDGEDGVPVRVLHRHRDALRRAGLPVPPRDATGLEGDRAEAGCREK